MSRSETEREIRETLGQIPSFFESMPDSTLENEWREFKVFQLTDTVLTAREKQLIGYAVAAAIHCPYCTYFHQSATAMMGTTREQLEEANRMASDTAKYSTYLHGLQVDIGEFKEQTNQIGEYLTEQASRRAA
jgi:AhpD family alkylhydroperoxidase